MSVIKQIPDADEVVKSDRTVFLVISRAVPPIVEMPNLVGYMESHDEERLMYKNLQFGNVAGEYNVKDVNTALERMKAANLAFLTVPGPKMIWEFGELGYDHTINECADGTVSNNCRVSAKVVKWDYRDITRRRNLENFVIDLTRIRRTYDLFTSGDVTFQNTNSLAKSVTVKSKPYNATPATTDQMNAHVIVNFDVTSQSFTSNFPHSGAWFDYYEGTELQVNSTSQAITVGPGGYKLFTDVQIPNQLTVVAGVPDELDESVQIYPNPTSELIFIKTDGTGELDFTLSTLQGQSTSIRKLGPRTWDMSSVAPGLYIGNIQSEGKVFRVKIMKR